MNDIERLHLLVSILLEYSASNTNIMGKLASDIESLCNSIDNTNEKFKSCYLQLWDTLEILHVNNYENKTQQNKQDIETVKYLIQNLIKEAESEITDRT